MNMTDLRIAVDRASRRFDLTVLALPRFANTSPACEAARAELTAAQTALLMAERAVVS